MALLYAEQATAAAPGSRDELWEKADEACAALFAEEDALQPVPGDVACTQIYGGDEEARIAGTVRGNAVDSMFSRTNGCEIDRWDRLAPVFEIG